MNVKKHRSFAGFGRLGPRQRAMFAGAFLALAGWCSGALAHGDDAPPPSSVNVAPRLETRLGDEELVITYLGGKVVAFLQRYVDGVPITGAQVQLTIDFTPTDLKEIAPGVYSSDAWQLSAGSNDVDIAVNIGDQKQTATLPLVIPSGEAKAASTASTLVVVGAVPGFVLVIAAAVVFLGVNGLLFRRRGFSGAGKTVAEQPSFREVVDDDLAGQHHPGRGPAHADRKQAAAHIEQDDRKIAAVA
jgi:hypothetical protein